MTDQANDFLKQYQAMVQQSWDAWTRALQPSVQAPSNPFMHASHAQGDDLVERMIQGLRGYGEWLQSAATSGIAGTNPDDWQAYLRQLFLGANPPFAQAFAGLDSSAAQGFAQQWQTWLQSMQPQTGWDFTQTLELPAFGFHRERQIQQQALAEAMRAYAQTYARYQALLSQASTQGFELLQSRLASLTEPGRQVESLKALYDLWVDAVEEAYADIALSGEFREAYGAMVNAQMHVRRLQQQQLEALCRELGMPTRSEVASLGARVQELRRELRKQQSQAVAASDHSPELAALRADVAALKRQLGQRAEPAPAKKAPSRKPDAVPDDGKRARKSSNTRRTPASGARGATRTRK